MVIRNSIISCLLVISFYFLGLIVPEKTTNSEELILGLIGVFLYGVASVFAFKALRSWWAKIKQNQYTNFYQKLGILPSLPIVLIWGFVFIAVAAVTYQYGI